MMFSTTLLSALAAASLTLAIPTGENVDLEKGFCFTYHNANFDKLAVSKVPLLNIVPKPYDTLAYNNFRSSSDGLVSTIAAHSPPNSVGFSLLTDTTGGAPTITRSYSDSKVKHFKMKSLWMSCVTINPTGVYLPVSCTVQAIGKKHHTGEKVYANLDFQAPLVPKLKLLKKKTKQQKQYFPRTFYDLDSVEFKVISAGVDASLTNVAFDNIEYRTVVPCRH